MQLEKELLCLCSWEEIHSLLVVTVTEVLLSA